MEVQPWFERDDYRAEARYLQLSESLRGMVDTFRDDGFVILEDTGIHAHTLDAVNQSLERQGASSDYMRGRVQDAWKTCPAVGQVATCAAVLEVLSVLYQRDPIPFQTLNFRVATQQRAHSDTIHFNTLPHGFMCGVWVALEDVDAENGPLFYHPGSQRLPVFHLDDLGIDVSPGEALERAGETYGRYEDRVQQVLQKSGHGRQEAHLKKGQALIWSSNIFHGGSRLLDPSRTRKSQVTHYYFPGCVYYTPLLSNPMKQHWELRRVSDIRTGKAVPDYGAVSARRSPWSVLRHLLGKRVR
ncbi:MAG: phytanoyl-CoA dioxygenase family protein [Rhodanobacter sp.]